MAKLLRPDISDQMGGCIGMSVRMTLKAHDATARSLRTPVAGLIELLLRKRRDQQPQAFELFRIQNAVEEFVEVLDRDEFALRDISKVRPCRQEDRCGKLRQEMIRQVEIQIEARQIAVFLFLDFIDVLQENSPQVAVDWQIAK